MTKLRLKIDELVENSGKRQGAIADEMGIRPATLSAYKLNKSSSWDVDILCKFIEYFDIKEIADLIEIIDPPKDQILISADEHRMFEQWKREQAKK